MVCLFIHSSSLFSSNLINLWRHFPHIRFMQCFQVAGQCMERERRGRERNTKHSPRIFWGGCKDKAGSPDTSCQIAAKNAKKKMDCSTHGGGFLISFLQISHWALAAIDSWCTVNARYISSFCGEL